MKAIYILYIGLIIQCIGSFITISTMKIAPGVWFTSLGIIICIIAIYRIKYD